MALGALLMAGWGPAKILAVLALGLMILGVRLLVRGIRHRREVRRGWEAVAGIRQSRRREFQASVMSSITETPHGLWKVRVRYMDGDVEHSRQQVFRDYQHAVRFANRIVRVSNGDQLQVLWELEARITEYDTIV